MNNNDIVNIVNTVINRDLSGNTINKSEMQTLINAQSKLLFLEYLGLPKEYARNQPVARKGAGVSKMNSSALRPFFVRTPISVVGGVCTLPTDCYYLLDLMPNTVSGRPFNELEPDEVADVLSSSVIAPTEKDPAYEWRDTTSLLVYPSTLSPVVATYYKAPREATLVYTTNSTTLLQEYSSSSVELEWKDTEKIEIAYRILRDAGLNIERSDVTQIGNQIANA